MIAYSIRLSIKKIINPLLFTIFLISPLVMGVFPVHADTEVGGPIYSDTTWTISNSPYHVIASIDILADVTLTIEPGVTIFLSSGVKIQVNGKLVARGTPDKLITFTPSNGNWGNIQFTSTAVTTQVDSNGNYVSGSVLQYCILEKGGVNSDSFIEAYSILIDHCIVRNSSARGIYNVGSASALSWTTNNIVSSHSVKSNYNAAGIYTENGVVSNNYVNNTSITGWGPGGGIYAKDSKVLDNTVSFNSIISNSSLIPKGAGIYANNSLVKGNTVTGNTEDGANEVEGAGIFAENNSTVESNMVNNNRVHGRIAGGGGIYLLNSTAINNTVFSNTVEGTYGGAYGGGIYSGTSMIKNNDFYQNNASSYSNNYGDVDGGGVYAIYSTIEGNYIRKNTAFSYTNYSGNGGFGGGLYAADCTVTKNTIENNSVAGNHTKGGAGAYLSQGVTFTYNLVIGNLEFNGIEVDGSLNHINYNSFLNNLPYDVKLNTGSDTDGVNNYWGSNNSVNILKQVFDWYDVTTLGKLLYTPFLQVPDPDSPLPTPSGLMIRKNNLLGITLMWNQILSFQTGWGYKIYYDTDSPTPPYTGTSLDQGESPIDVGSITSFLLSGLDPKKTYYFVVTTYNNQGKESWYSEKGRYFINLPFIKR
jgi:hypothetical protein